MPTSLKELALYNATFAGDEHILASLAELKKGQLPELKVVAFTYDSHRLEEGHSEIELAHGDGYCCCL